MKFLDDLIHNKIKPHFEKGGSLEKFYYAFEAGESFHFVTDKRTDTGAHVRDYVDLKRMMVIFRLRQQKSVTAPRMMVPSLLFHVLHL